MEFTNKFIFFDKPYGWYEGGLYRLEYEKGPRNFPLRKLMPQSYGNRSGYSLGTAFFSNEEIINLATKKQYEYTERVNYANTTNEKMVDLNP